MLKAAPDRKGALGLLQMVLTSVERNHTEQLSDTLKKHVIEVLNTASLIAEDPKLIGPNTPAEAIELALRLRGHKTLTHQISAVRRFDSIKADLAKDLLKSLRTIAA